LQNRKVNKIAKNNRDTDYNNTECDTDCETERYAKIIAIPNVIPIAIPKGKNNCDTDTDIRFSHFFNKIQAEKHVCLLLFEPFN
jgi:hypothetical protein